MRQSSYLFAAGVIMLALGAAGMAFVSEESPAKETISLEANTNENSQKETGEAVENTPITPAQGETETPPTNSPIPDIPDSATNTPESSPALSSSTSPA